MRGATFIVIAATGCFIKPDPPSGGDDGNGSGVGVPPNIAFVTSMASDVAELQSQVVADEWCMQAARSATTPLEGTYRAWMSSPEQPAQNRFAGARGWVRVDGKPFIDSIDDLVTERRVFYPLRIDENGNDVLAGNPLGPPVITATDKAGNVDYDCVGEANMTRGFADAGGEDWTDEGSMPCTSPELVRLYCLGVDRASRVDPPPVTGPRVFVTETPVMIGGGVAAFDQRCATDATVASLTGTFVAVVAMAASSANARIGGGTRQLSWVRVDGVEVTTDFVTMHAPINVTAKGHYLDQVMVWNGAIDANALGTGTCSDWASTSSGDSARIGAATRSNSNAFGIEGQLTGCTALNMHLYCAEVQP